MSENNHTPEEPSRKATKVSRETLDEAFFHLTGTVPGAATIIAGGTLFVANVYEGVADADESRALPAVMYYLFTLGSAALLKRMNEVREKAKESKKR